MGFHKDVSGDYIRNEVARARRLYTCYGDRLREEVQDYLEKTLECVELSRRVMRELGVDKICRICDVEEGGSCCGRGIENYYGASLLLANILVGVDPSDERYDDKGCFFLGPEGCTLLFRHTLCVNYLCRKIYDNLGKDSIILLQEVCGREMDALFELNERILAFLKVYGNGSTDLRNS